MKKSILLLLLPVLLMFVQTLSAQVINVPSKSEKHFAKKYPEAKNIDWTNNVTSYSAQFQLHGEKYKAHYHMDGIWYYTEKHIDKDKLPDQVKTSYQNSRVADWTYESAAGIENNKGEKLYRLEVKKGIEKKYIFYDKHGKEIKSTLAL